MRRAATWSWSHATDLLFVLIASLILAWVSYDGFVTRLVTLSQGADYWEHSATLNVLLENPWRPTNPHLVSDASSPRFVPLFILAALIGKAFGLDSLGAMGVVTLLNTTLFLVGIYCFFRTYFRDARASLYGLIVCFASWQDGPHFSNVYQLKIFFSTAAYPSTTALGLSLIGFTLLLQALRAQRGWRSMLALAPLWAVLIVTHPLTAVMGLCGAGLLSLTEPGLAWKTRLRALSGLALGLLLANFWPYFSLRGVLHGGGKEEVDAILERLAGTDSEPSGGLHPFYRPNTLLGALGFAIAGLPVCLWLMIRRRHWFISLGALSMLIPFVINARYTLPLGHRFFLLAIFFLQVALVWLLLLFTPRAPEAIRRVTTGKLAYVSAALVALALAWPAWTNAQSALGRFSASVRRLAAGGPNVRYASAVAEVAGKNAVILADARTSWPLPTFGPKVLLLLHGNPLVKDEPSRGAAVGQFMRRGRGNDRQRREILQRYGVTHVLLTGRQNRTLAGFFEGVTWRAMPGGHVLYTL
jgi:hypothetical protein